ncbi:hypothetical protein JKP88DRAFT_248650 [Tribonema minus]|uniref:Uncharacterized protein n=1 Tax=Tribonema minus TaxID=303371 RepID=A0A836C972_9STRA|nr:hypothetical protein JKP88DRAFT_248650 [Tribonema minus]
MYSKFDPKIVIFASAPAVSAGAATVTSCVAPPSTPTPSVVKPWKTAPCSTMWNGTSACSERDMSLKPPSRPRSWGELWVAMCKERSFVTTRQESFHVLFKSIGTAPVAGATAVTCSSNLAPHPQLRMCPPQVLYAGDAVPSTVKLREDGWCNLSDLCDHRDSLLSPIWLEFINVGLCQRLRSPIAVALPTVVAAAAIVMEERQRPRTPHFVLFKTHNTPTFDTLTSFLDDLGEVLSSVHVPCFDMRTTPRHLVYKKQIHNVGPHDYAPGYQHILNDKLVSQLSQRALARRASPRTPTVLRAIAEYLVHIAPGAPMQAWQALQQLQQADGVAPVSTCLEAIMQGLALQDTATAAAGGAAARSIDATYLQHRTQCERQHTELQGSVAEMRRAIAAERCSLSELQRDKEAAVSRRHSVVQDLTSTHSTARQRLHLRKCVSSCSKRILDDDSLQQILNWYAEANRAAACFSKYCRCLALLMGAAVVNACLLTNIIDMKKPFEAARQLAP